jgi:protein-S-isoprenylcysteine O-methyltransferase Ste14
MTLATRKKAFIGAVVVVNLAILFLSLISLLEGKSLGASLLNLLWRLVLANAVSLLLWRGGEISQNPAKNKPLP